MVLQRSNSCHQGGAHGDSGSGECAAAPEINVDRSGRSSPFVDRPHDQGLTASTIARRKDSRYVRRELAMFSLVVATRIIFDPQNFAGIVLWSQEAHRQQNQVGSDDLFASRNFLHCHLSVFGHPTNANRLDPRDIPLSIIDELFAENAIGAMDCLPLVPQVACPTAQS
jgi:hypothetical protein